MLLDIAIGILASLGIGSIFGFTPSPFFIWASIAFALLPDLDFLYALARFGSKNYHAIIRHREYLHYPLPYAVASIFIALLAGPAWGLVFFIAVFGHLLHDSIGLGWGVRWLWPFTRDNYTFFWRYVAPEKKLPRQLIYCWREARIDALIEEYRDPNWLRNIYLKPHPFFATEIIGFAAAVFVLTRVLR